MAGGEGEGNPLHELHRVDVFVSASYQRFVRNILLLLLIVACALWVWGLRRAATLFTLRVRRGRVVFSQGRLPPRLLSELVDIIDRAGIVKANIRGVVREGQPVLLFQGELSPAVAQQMRNVVGQFTVQQIRHGQKRG